MKVVWTVLQKHSTCVQKAKAKTSQQTWYHLALISKGFAKFSSQHRHSISNQMIKNSKQRFVLFGLNYLLIFCFCGKTCYISPIQHESWTKTAFSLFLWITISCSKIFYVCFCIFGKYNYSDIVTNFLLQCKFFFICGFLIIGLIYSPIILNKYILTSKYSDIWIQMKVLGFYL